MNLQIRIIDGDGTVLYESKESYFDMNNNKETRTHKDVHDFGIKITVDGKEIGGNKNHQRRHQENKDRKPFNTNKEYKKPKKNQKPLFDRIKEEKEVQTNLVEIEKPIAPVIEQPIPKVEINDKPNDPGILFNNKDLNKSQIGASKLTEDDIMNFLNNTKQLVSDYKKSVEKKGEKEVIKEPIAKEEKSEPVKKQKTLAEKVNKYKVLYKSKEKIKKMQEEEKQRSYDYDEYSEYEDSPTRQKIVNNRKGGEF